MLGKACIWLSSYNLLLRSCGLGLSFVFRLLLAVPLIEAINAPRSVHKFLLARKKRVAFRANLYVQVALARRACGERVAAGALHLYIVIIRMNSLLHFPLFVPSL